MYRRLKPLKDQVIVITGASSGIGLATARLAAERGAKLVLAARSVGAIEQLQLEIEQQGGDALAVETDVADATQVAELARRAVDYFGTFDTWVNNAGVGLYGPMLDVPFDDSRQLFETNFWGVVYGSHAAVRHFAERGGSYPGALINVGSTVSDRAIPIQGMYSASKHAVKGFTDALRMELEADDAPVVVTLVKPGSINTPYPQHARNYMDREPTLPAPVYDPAIVAETILHCAAMPTRDVFVGGGGKLLAALGRMAPSLADRFMEWTMIQEQQKDEPPRDPQGALETPSDDGLQERGDYEGRVARTSLYTAASLHPVLSAAVVLGVGMGLAALLKGSQNGMGTRVRSALEGLGEAVKGHEGC